MSTFSSAAALVAAILAGLALMFVWAGTETVQLDWVAMDNDQSLAHLAQVRHPVTDADTAATQAAMSSGPPAPTVEGVNRVVWINIAGFRGDYLERVETPWLKEVASSGSTTSALLPPFPSLHYPSLLTQATGLGVATHGIIGDKLRDPDTREIVRRPTKLAYLKAEPVWTLAKRQGHAVLVHDWPFSQEQPEDAPADLYLKEFDEAKTDEQRLAAVWEAWSGFTGEKKLSLVMASLHDVAKAARANGSREQATNDAVAKLDGDLKGFFDKVKEKWEELSQPGDTLHVILTTDHGMTDSEKVINFAKLMGPLAEQVDFFVDGAMASIWFKEPPAGMTTDAFLKKYDEELRARIYWRFYPRGEYPANFQLGAGGPFLGDRVLVLKGGYSFTETEGSEPVFAPSETGGPFSNGGYPYQDSSRMKGQAFFFRLDGSGRSGDLGDVEAARLYPTVCKLLGLKGSPAVTVPALEID